MSDMKESQIKILLEKINLLYRIFEKEGIHKISAIEKELLKEQAQNLLFEIESLPCSTYLAAATKATTNTAETPIVEKPEVISEVSETRLEVEVEKEKPIVVAPVSTEVIEPKLIIPEPKQVAQNEHLSINEKMAQLQDEKEQEPAPLTNGDLRNMKEIIDLNKSFIFKKELFQNDNDAYNSFINQLNQTKDEIQAINVLEQFAEKYFWDKEDKIYELITRSVEKRFMPIL